MIDFSPLSAAIPAVSALLRVEKQTHLYVTVQWLCVFVGSDLSSQTEAQHHRNQATTAQGDQRSFASVVYNMSVSAMPLNKIVS